MSAPRVPGQGDIFDSYRLQLSAITEPKEKLEKLDELTFTELTSSSFQVLEQIGRDPRLSEVCMSPTSPLGSLQAGHIVKVLRAVEGCKKLSSEVLSSIEINYSWTVCPLIDTYINNKIYQVLGRIFLVENFAN